MSTLQAGQRPVPTGAIKYIQIFLLNLLTRGPLTPIFHFRRERWATS